MNKASKDILIGLIVAVILPLAGISVFYLYQYGDHPIQEYLGLLQANKLIAPVISVSLLPNLIGFYYFLRRDEYKRSQGVILGMLLWGVVIILFKWVI